MMYKRKRRIIPLIQMMSSNVGAKRHDGDIEIIETGDNEDRYRNSLRGV